MKSEKGDGLEIRWTPLSKAKRWERNRKRHGLEEIAASIRAHGFKDPPKFEPALNGGKGGLVEGNGRCQVLAGMKQAKEEPPRGVRVGEKGEWLIPVLFGVDARSESEAEAYGLDHNNLVLAGGDFEGADILRLYDGGNIDELLADMDELPVSLASLSEGVDEGDEADSNSAGEGGEAGDSESSGEGKQWGAKRPDGPLGFEASGYPLAVVLTKADMSRWKAYKAKVGKSADKEAFLDMLAAVGA